MKRHNLKKTLFAAFSMLAVLTLLVFGGGDKKGSRGMQGEPPLQAKSQAAAPLSELEVIKSGLDREGILSAIGAGESACEMTARSIATDNARAELAKSVDTGAAGQASEVYVRGSSVHTSITRYDAKNNVYRVYALVTAREVIPR